MGFIDCYTGDDGISTNDGEWLYHCTLKDRFQFEISESVLIAVDPQTNRACYQFGARIVYGKCRGWLLQSANAEKPQPAGEPQEEHQ
jgi:hypothetical protein